MQSVCTWKRNSAHIFWHVQGSQVGLYLGTLSASLILLLTMAVQRPRPPIFCANWNICMLKDVISSKFYCLIALKTVGCSNYYKWNLNSIRKQGAQGIGNTLFKIRPRDFLWTGILVPVPHPPWFLPDLILCIYWSTVKDIDTWLVRGGGRSALGRAVAHAPPVRRGAMLPTAPNANLFLL